VASSCVGREAMLAGMQVSRSTSGRVFQHAGVFSEVGLLPYLAEALGVPAGPLLEEKELLFEQWHRQDVVG
jgi:hypothetical protein